MIILGAGLSGTLAGALNKDADIFETRSNDTTHKAVLRFRSPEISEAIGIPFKKVKVYKYIWYEDMYIPLSPRMMNLYSYKVSDTFSARSIVNLETATRWIAPDDLLGILKEQCKGRIKYGIPLTRDFIKDCQQTLQPIISTVPLYVMAKLFELYDGDMSHKFNDIYINQFNIKNCDVYQTIYYPDPDLLIYRATISGDTLIIESTSTLAGKEGMSYQAVWKSFGLWESDTTQTLTNHLQHNGKIMPINEKIRRRLIYDLTVSHGIYSLGRFATWRHILMDDVYKDIHVIKSLINKDAYEHKLEDSK